MQIHLRQPVEKLERYAAFGVQPHSMIPLSFYSQPPSGPVSLQEFESYAFDRLILLKELEAIRAKGGSEAEQRHEIEFAEKKFQKENSNEGLSQVLYREAYFRKDELSHFILRLAFCHSEELRSWFRRMESELFRFRFERLSEEQQKLFLESNRISFDEVKSAELQSIVPMLLQTATYVKGKQIYKVHFVEALDLISRRRVYVQKGIAYVPKSELIYLISTRFRASLSKSLIIALQAVATKRYDPRLESLLLNLSTTDTNPSYQSRYVPGTVKPENIAALAEKSFPLCMQHLHEALVRDNHLKYGGRQQFGLFLKGIGLSLEDALRYFNSIFSRKPSAQNFDKAYAYNIRHNYGKEGKRVDYAPPSCRQIINGTAPGYGEYHGCPFRHFDKDHLLAKLRYRKIHDRDIQSIIKFVEEKHYQLACREYFKIVHNGRIGDKVGNHPNEYFEESVALLEGIAGNHITNTGSADSEGRGDAMEDV